MTKRIAAAVCVAAVPAIALVATQPSQAVTEPKPPQTRSTTTTASETMADCDMNRHGEYGWGCFYPHGDKMQVNDTLWDGWGVVVHWKTSYGREGHCAAEGADYGPKTCNYNMREGETVRFRVELWDDGQADGWNEWEYTTI